MLSSTVSKITNWATTASGILIGVVVAVAIVALTIFFIHMNSSMDFESCNMLRTSGKIIPDCVLR